MAGALKALPALLLAALVLACGTSLAPLPEVDTVIGRAADGDDEALATLVRYFDSPVEGESLKALTALIEARGRAVPHLIEALDDDDPLVSETAAGALGNIRDPRSLDPLVRTLAKPGGKHYAVIWALGEVGGEGAVEPLLEALGSDDREVGKYAARALVKMGPAVVPAAIGALDGTKANSRRYALRVLGQIGSPGAAPAIVERYARLDPEAALWALGRLGDRSAFPAMAAEAADPDWRIRLAAAQALGALADPAAVPVLKGLLEDPEWVVREWAARGIEEITTERQLYRDQYGKMVLPYNLYR